MIYISSVVQLYVNVNSRWHLPLYSLQRQVIGELIKEHAIDGPDRILVILNEIIRSERISLGTISADDGFFIRKGNILNLLTKAKEKVSKI